MIGSVDELFRKKRELCEKQQELVRMERKVVEIKNLIAGMEKEIKSANMPKTMTIRYWYINDGGSWVAIEESGILNITIARENAAEKVEVLRNIIEEVENMPYRKAELFAKENSRAIGEIEKDIERIKLNFNL